MVPHNAYPAPTQIGMASASGGHRLWSPADEVRGVAA